MFRKLQVKMTAYYTIILIAILLVTNISIYFLMATYNNYQLSKETETMVNGITDTDWIQEYPAIHNEEDEDEDEYDSENELLINDIGEFFIPNSLKSFSFYFIYSLDDILIKWKTSDENLFYSIQDKLKENDIGPSPTVITLEQSGNYYYLAMRLPITINGITYGYFYAGRDVTIAYETLNNLQQILIISLIAGILVSLLLGFLIAGRAIKPIKEAYELKQRFLADASHELRTPISIILLSAELLQKEEKASEDIHRRTVKGIKEEARKMAGLVENLLMLARADSSDLNLRKSNFNISELLKSRVDSFKALAEEKNIIIKQNIEDNIECFGDEKRLETVVSILLDNAVKYTGEGGKITVTARNEADLVQFCVSDSGIGIAGDEVDRIFERFFRHETSRSKKTGGYGLGLAIAKEIIEQHEGIIEVISQLGKGSHFTVKLNKKKRFD